MIIAAHQPNFLPNLAFFSKMKAVDKFIIITNLQFEKNEGWQYRHKLSGKNGDIWLTIPTLGSQNQLIRDVRIKNGFPWSRKHKRTIQLLYTHSKEKHIISEISKLYDQNWDRLADLNVAFIKLIAAILEIKTPIIIDEKCSGKEHKLLIHLCKKYNADTYLSGVGAKLYMTKDYLDEIETSGIKHKIVDRNLTVEFPYSTVHYLLSEGRDWVNNHI